MKAIGLMTPGGPEVLNIVDLPPVSAGPGQVRVKVVAVAVNPTDLLLRNGAFSAAQETQSRPLVPGMDIAGIVDEVGANVETNIHVGDRVMGIVVPEGSYGAYRQQIVLDARSVALAPQSKTLYEASTIAMNGLTAIMSLDLLNLQPGQTLAVTGAAGIYGGYVIQLAKHRGLTVIADAAAKDEERVRRYGADIVVPRGDDVASHIRHYFPQGVDGLADGAVLNERAIPAVKDGGSFTSVRLYEGNGARDIAFSKTFVGDYCYHTDALNSLTQYVDQGILTPEVAALFKPEEAAEAHRLLEKGGVRGRFVIRFDE
ncbi:NADP-dependent oxidoreductase [Pantoea osteomyelitidis]|uniref:NADP-dependent oxidoreductase n=1 Tax=Pantoea osteomyelitidis TaxID=3230026 RepID=A0ABW7PZH0_9GAMM